MLSQDYISSLVQNCQKLCKKWRNNKAINTTISQYKALEMSKIYLKQNNDVVDGGLAMKIRNPVNFEQIDQFQ
jgi:hypothetical protein